MGSKISQLNELDTLTGNEEGVVAYQGTNFRFKLKKVASLVSKEDLGLDQVDNTRDKDKIISDPTLAALEGKANTQHDHAISDVSGLQVALDGKSDVDHHHVISDVDGLDQALDDKSNIDHTHEISGVNGLEAALEGKAALQHGHSINDVNGLGSALQNLNTSLGQKAALIHQHAIADIPGLSDFVDQKIADAVDIAEVVFPTQEW